MSANDWALSRKEVDGRFDSLVAGVREYAVFVVAPDGTIMCWNPGAERLLGYQSNEIVGHHFSRFFSPEDIRSGQAEFELTASRANGRADSARWHIRKDGSRFWCASTITPLLDECKQVQSFVRVMHDLTDSEAQTAQKKRADDLAEANRSREEFMAILSHELRNPLSPILNALGILKGIASVDPIVQQAGSVIERQIGHMVRLVDDLLDVSRIAKGKLRLTIEPVELRVVVNRASESARPLIEARKHEFSVALPMHPIWVNADATRLEQIFVNLLNNAANYTNPPGLIQIAVEQEGSEAVVRVQDNGVGIATEALPHIFEMFRQVDESALMVAHSGLGIGLALVGTLVEMHGGRVQAHSAGLGKGTEFIVRLPTVPAVPIAVLETDAIKVEQKTRSLRVLIVEDNIDSGDTLSMLLRLSGHEVLLARSGITALEAAPEFHPDVVLCDLGLPGLNGYEVAEALRALPDFDRVTICALSGFTPSDADRDRPEQAGFNHHFVKPVPFDVLLKLFASIN